MKTGRLILLTAAALVMIGMGSCGTNKAKEMVTTEDFGSFEGKDVFLYTLTNKQGDIIKLTNYGATIVEINVPDRTGNRANVTFGYDTFEGYLKGDAYFGKVVGQYANRIAKGKFTLDGVEYTLALNNGPNTLHGGPTGWHSRVWTSEVLKNTDYPAVKFTYDKPDMEEGYPGNLVAEVIYTWTDENEIIMDYKVTTDRKTVINITNHAYFNLHGAGVGDILDHEVLIRASAFTPVDSSLIPTGELRPVEGSPFDFRSPHLIGERIGEEYDQLVLGAAMTITLFLIMWSRLMPRFMIHPRAGCFRSSPTSPAYSFIPATSLTEHREAAVAWSTSTAQACVLKHSITLTAPTRFPSRQSS